MKKLILLLGFVVLAFPVLAQMSDDTPQDFLILKKGNIPTQVQIAAEKLFQGDTQVAWGTFPYELKNYGWVVNKDYNEPIDHYEVKFKASNGSDIYAVFESTGELISTKIINKNAPVPPPIMIAISDGKYKDWQIVGDILLIKNTQKKVVEHYAVTLKKGDMTKHLYFTVKGEELPNT